MTNLPVPEKPLLNLTKSYSDKLYKKYIEYPDVINVDKLCDIPKDYYEVMGVPITIMTHHNPNQFKILGMTNKSRKNKSTSGKLSTSKASVKVGGEVVSLFTRIFIKRVISQQY